MEVENNLNLDNVEAVVLVFDRICSIMEENRIEF